MDLNEVKEKSRHFLLKAWENEIGQDYDSPYLFDPRWVEIRKVLQAIDEVENCGGIVSNMQKENVCWRGVRNKNHLRKFPCWLCT